MLFCHFLPCCNFSVLSRLFFYPTNPSISYVHYKLEIYIVGVQISGKNNFKKMYIKQDPNLIWNQGARFKASGHFLHYFFFQLPYKNGRPGNLKTIHFFLEIQNGVVAITVGTNKITISLNILTYTNILDIKRGFSITLIVVLDAYK